MPAGSAVPLPSLLGAGLVSLPGRVLDSPQATDASSEMGRFHNECQCSLSVQTELFRWVFQFVAFLLLDYFRFPLSPTQNLINEGYAVAQLVNQLHDTVVESEDYSDKQKSVIVEKLAVSLQLEVKNPTLISTD